MIKVLLVDDHQLVRVGTKYILEKISGIRVIGQVSSGEEAIQWCRKNQSLDIILMDISLPGMSGIEAIQRLKKIVPEISIIAFTMHDEGLIAQKILKLEISGFVSKNCSQEEIEKALKTVASGGRYIPAILAQKLLLETECLSKNCSSENLLMILSDREWQIASRIIEGKKVSDIAQELFLSPKTVNSYRYRIFKKLCLDGDVSLVRLGLEQGLYSKKLPALSSEEIISNHLTTS